MLDYDAARSKLRKLEAKPSEDPTKLPKADQEYNDAKEVFELLNRQLQAWNYRPKSWKGILQSLLNRLGKPPFPRSKWECVIRGEPANFKVILGEYKSTKSTSEASTSLGDFKISFGGGQLGRRDVLTSQDWSTVFDAFTDAILYIWPEQITEFTRYR